MNILHMKYALEVAKAGSLTKASKVLFVAPPNISRSVKELEADLGIEIFIRTTKGVKLTPEGEEFIAFAQRILSQIEAQEQFYKNELPKAQRFSISVPRACYISEAFAEFTKSLKKNTAEVFYRETNAKHTIQDVANDDYNLGVIRYAANFDRYFKEMLEGSGITYELITEFTYALIMSREHPLADKDDLTLADLKEYIEITKADSYVPEFSFAAQGEKNIASDVDRRIYIFERASEFDLLSTNTETFMWVSPTPQRILDRYNLVLKKCSENNRVYRDLLIYKKGYKLSQLDNIFMTNLIDSKRSAFKNLH